MTDTDDMRRLTNGFPADAAPQVVRDDTTRYLCAAAHLDPEYANNAIREFLNEETRQVPPSPGMNAAAVLGEAVAARTRRKLRDTGLILLLIAAVFLAPTALLIGWVVLSVLVALPGLVKESGLSSKRVGVLVLGVLVLIVVLVFGGNLVRSLFGSSSPSYDYSSPYPGATYAAPADHTGQTIGFVVVVLGMLAVLLADRFVVWRHICVRFARDPQGRSVEPIPDRQVFQFSPNRFVAQLKRYADPKPTVANRPAGVRALPGEPAPLIVYRGYKPFVGAGLPEAPWSVAVPLEALPSAEPPRPLTTDALYAGISREISGLRRAAALAPGRRLGDLALDEQVIVSADELIDHLADPSSVDFLRAPQVPPYTMVRRDRLESIKVDPLEWGRYYQCYQVETWDRDLVVSVFVHVAVDSGTLYVEWTPCVLRPIKKAYQRIDQTSRSAMLPVGQALLDLVGLPAAIPGKLGHTLSFIKPLPKDSGVINPDAYGVQRSLRELAADTKVHNYFQLADIDRYVKMIESRFVLAVSRMMAAAGYSAASFERQAAMVIDNSVRIGGSVGGNVVSGIGNRVGPVAPAQPSAGGAAK